MVKLLHFRKLQVLADELKSQSESVKNVVAPVTLNVKRCICSLLFFQNRTQPKLDRFLVSLWWYSFLKNSVWLLQKKFSTTKSAIEIKSLVKISMVYLFYDSRTHCFLTRLDLWCCTYISRDYTYGSLKSNKQRILSSWDGHRDMGDASTYGKIIRNLLGSMKLPGSNLWADTRRYKYLRASQVVKSERDLHWVERGMTFWIFGSNPRI